MIILKVTTKWKITEKKVVVCSNDPENINFQMDDDNLKQVPKFKYLGSITREDWKSKGDIIQRITEAEVMCNNKTNYSAGITLVWK